MIVALCDDEPQENEHVKKLIDGYALEKNLDIRCETFSSGEALLQRDKFDVYLLDYFMEEMDGVTLARRLGEKFGGAVTVCFLTNYENAAIEVINNRVYADGFLKKPVQEAQLYEKLDFFYNKTFRRRLLLRKGTRRETVWTQDILYAEAKGKRTVLHLFNETREYNYLLHAFESEFLADAGFFRIHRSFSVNLQYVESYDAASVRLKNGETLPLKSRDFAAAYRNFIFEST